MKHITTECKSFLGCTKEVREHEGHSCVWEEIEHDLEHCTVGCPLYNSGHSIDASGFCNMGCC